MTQSDSNGFNPLPAVNPSKQGEGKNPGGPGYIPAVTGPKGPSVVVKTANDSVKGVVLGNYPKKPPRKM